MIVYTLIDLVSDCFFIWQCLSSSHVGHRESVLSILSRPKPKHDLEALSLLCSLKRISDLNIGFHASS